MDALYLLGQVDLGGATAAIQSGTEQAKSMTGAITILLSSLLAIAIVIILYKQFGNK